MQFSPKNREIKMTNKVLLRIQVPKIKDLSEQSLTITLR